MTDCDKLKGIISDIDDLLTQPITASSPAFKAWYTKAERFLIKKFGKTSLEYEKLSKTSFAPMFFYEDTKPEVFIRYCKNGLLSCRAIFGTYLDDIADEEAPAPINSAVPQNLNMDKVFIVHGHDGELKHAVARLIEKQGLSAIILSEQVNKGKTIIEKFEENSDVGGAICLFTADDFGRAKASSLEQPRARQNVVFEAGFFMGKLGRNRVVIIAESGVELPSDMQGIVYYNESNWEIDVLKELREMGYAVDLNKLVS